MKQTFRWYGPNNDLVSLNEIKQIGVQGIVTSLHNKKTGEVWEVSEIKERQEILSEYGYNWDVVESVEVHNDIKTKKRDYKKYIANYQQTIINLAECGVKTVCYNFMSILDWMRTNYYYELEDGVKALRFDMTALCAFDLFILKREGAEKDYSDYTIRSAEAIFRYMSAKDKKQLETSILAGLPGTSKVYSIDDFKAFKKQFSHIDRETLQEHLVYFMNHIMPVAEEEGVNMCIHPDDPPFPTLGIPRITSSLEDFDFLFSEVKTRNNGLTFCTGALGASKKNDLEKIFTAFADRIHFVHLRSTEIEEEGVFYEANHLEGGVDMYAIVKLVLEEEKRRREEGRSDHLLPFRPDHGHQMLDDLIKEPHPGYGLIGRMKGLAEIRGLEMGVKKAFDL